MITEFGNESSPFKQWVIEIADRARRTPNCGRMWDVTDMPCRFDNSIIDSILASCDYHEAVREIPIMCAYGYLSESLGQSNWYDKDWQCYCDVE